jgi:regulator of RNase E activity RraA
MTPGFRLFPRAGAITAELSLGQFNSTDLSDGMHRAGTMSGIVAVYRPLPTVCGPAITVSVPGGGFSMVKLGLQQCRPGDVFVISARGELTNAVWGGNLNLGAQRRGLAGVVVDGAIRDVDQIRSTGLPVFAAGIATSASPISVPFGEVNVPVACGRIVVNPGDTIVADVDGIVCVRPSDAAAVAAATAAIVEGHDRVMPLLERGEVTNHVAIEQSMLDAGLAIADRPWP